MIALFCLLSSWLGSPDETRLEEPPERIPIPVVDPSHGRYQLVREVGAGTVFAGQSFRLVSNSDDTRRETTWGRNAGRRTITRIFTGEHGHMYRVTGTSEGLAAKVYVGHRLTVLVNAERSRSGVRLASCLTYDPYEGVQVGIGWEPLRNRFFLRFACSFDDAIDLLQMWMFLRHVRH